MARIAFKTPLGVSYHGLAEDLLIAKRFSGYKQNVNLILTSPPYPLNRKKKYGNRTEEEYLKWLSELAPLMREYLANDGSIVIELGNSWQKGSPTMSTLALRSLLSFMEEGNLQLCQQFVWFNTAKLPTPAPWVTKERIRVKDAFTNIWWLSKTDRPKADNRKVLSKYSKKMQNLLQTKQYNAGRRPSDHNISETSFLQDNGGSIPPNVIVSSNTHSRSRYQDYCKEKDLPPHPARMPKEIAQFFISFLTDEGDTVLDTFAGSNTTGEVAEELERKWIAVEADDSYIAGSVGRFKNVKKTIRGI
jgi:site-specific DNA-methyltransferase (cytosine-N4-specific)